VVHFVDVGNNCLIISVSIVDGMSSGNCSAETLAVGAAGSNYCG